ncbi:MAG: aminomethyl transferase family protein [Desulfobulbus sp.]|jgi:aminomethyltransferase|uniref:aminomethyltransferase family protein n=1 Tax=Desulfobulbus sp. TaxID=895 RepID=UPI00284C738A|nr:aminomethyl transferase family protein [Desulfobulbus sp.]MDR2551189.1 aminomethyl transferase family protein [Desulfobulbus sp.]
MALPLKTTPLHAWHVGHGAKMAAFGGYEMPLWYPAGAKAEHLAPIAAAGLFDTSHMAVLTLRGPAVRPLLQRCFSKDLDRCIGTRKTPLVPGRCVYGVFLDEAGGVLDDAIISQCGEQDYLLVVNAAMGGPIAAHLRQHNQDDPGAAIDDHTDAIGKMDLQGPAAAKILARILRAPDRVFDRMVYFSFKGTFAPHLLPGEPVTLLDGTPILVSRTGYTGEFGFELFVAPEHAVRLWQMLLEAGAPEGLLPCGLAARDSLRAGAGLPLSHQDIGTWLFACNPWLFVLPWDEDGGGFTKEFIGGRAIQAARSAPCTLAFAGFDPRKIALGEASRATALDGTPLGSVLTCTTDMAIDRVDGILIGIATPMAAGRPQSFAPRGLCCGFVRLEAPLPAGTEILLTDGKRTLKVEIRDQIRPDRTARSPLTAMLA